MAPPGIVSISRSSPALPSHLCVLFDPEPADPCTRSHKALFGRNPFAASAKYKLQGLPLQAAKEKTG